MIFFFFGGGGGTVVISIVIDCHVGFISLDVVVSWSYWGIVLACSEFGLPGAITYRIRILDVKFPLLATFVLLRHFCF